MSSILKALKKLENEKATRQPDSLKIDSDILRSDPPSGVSFVTIILLSFLLIAGGAGATYLFMMRTPSQKKNVSSAQLPVISPQPPAQPVQSQSATIPTETLPPAVVIVPASKSNAEVTAQQPLKLKKQLQSVKIPPVSDVSTHRQAAAENNKPATTSKTNTQETASIPTLRVNGIAWQNSSADSMAIINGVAVSNGKVIEGVEVEEIQKDRVRFSYHGEKFEIPLGQSNR